MYYVVWPCVKTLEKYIVKIPGKNLPNSSEFEMLLTRSKMASSDMIICTAKQCFSKYWKSDKGPKLRMDDLQIYSHNYWLAATR